MMLVQPQTLACRVHELESLCGRISSSVSACNVGAVISSGERCVACVVPYLSVLVAGDAKVCCTPSSLLSASEHVSARVGECLRRFASSATSFDCAVVKFTRLCSSHGVSICELEKDSWSAHVDSICASCCSLLDVLDGVCADGESVDMSESPPTLCSSTLCSSTLPLSSIPIPIPTPIPVTESA
ncbi:hypothetical protein ADUPG1_005450, partial [Aduncisulcus paluster]